MRKKEEIFLNERALKFRDLQVIDENKKLVGVISARTALQMAKDAGLDLFVISPAATPPVAKILDYGQMKYEKAKQERSHHKHKQDTKEIKISARIHQHDLDFLIKRAIKFLEHGDKVKITCVFKAREIEHPEFGLQIINAMLSSLDEFITYEGSPVLQGKFMSIVVDPKK